MVAGGQRPARGELWWANLDPIVGSEQAGRRPVLILSADHYQRIQDRLIIIAPLTRTLRHYPFHIQVSTEDSGSPDGSAVMCDQIRTISTRRLLGPRPAGRLPEAIINPVETAI